MAGQMLNLVKRYLLLQEIGHDGNAKRMRAQTVRQSGGTEFVLVGAAHLLGDEGILKKLRDRGYAITRL